MKKKNLFITLITLILTLSTVVLAGCSGGSGTTNTPTENWVTLAEKVKNGGMYLPAIYTTLYTGKDETQIENLNFYENILNRDDSEEVASLLENKLELNTYESFHFSAKENAYVKKLRFEIVSEKDQEFIFEFGFFGGKEYGMDSIERAVRTQAGIPYMVELSASDFEDVTGAGSIEVKLRNIPMVEDVFHQQNWYNTNIKWTIQNVAFVNV